MELQNLLQIASQGSNFKKISAPLRSAGALRSATLRCGNQFVYHDPKGPTAAHNPRLLPRASRPHALKIRRKPIYIRA